MSKEIYLNYSNYDNVPHLHGIIFISLQNYVHSTTTYMKYLKMDEYLSNQLQSLYYQYQIVKIITYVISGVEKCIKIS